MQILERFNEIIQDVAEPFVLEIGSCDGYHSNKLLEIIKSKDRPFIFHCFEPNKDLHLQILSNLHGHLMFNNGVIGLFPNAVGAKDEETTFYVSYGEKIESGEVLDHYYGSSSILKPKLVKQSFPQMKFREDKVFVTTLDRHLQKYSPYSGRIIDFIWMDVQGAELDVFAGGQRNIKKARYIYTEYSDSEDYEGQGNLNDILNALPNFEIVEDYGGDVLLKNKYL